MIDTISISLFLTLYLILIGDINEVMEKPKYSVIPSLVTALILIADEMNPLWQCIIELMGEMCIRGHTFSM